MKTYRYHAAAKQPKHRRWPIALACVACVVVAAALAYGTVSWHKKSTPLAHYDRTVGNSEQQKITQHLAAKAQGTPYSVSVSTVRTPANAAHVLEAYVPVTNPYATRSNVTSAEIATMPILFDAHIDPTVRAELTRTLRPASAKTFELGTDSVQATDIAIIPASQLSPTVKLLALDGTYYLDAFTSGALFREAQLPAGAEGTLSDLPTKDTTLKLRITGVTALTRLIMKKLDSVRDPRYFSAKIGTFLADADETHISNESSFVNNCTYSNTTFCTKPEFIETLKASGVDFVELTGNHNNDFGSEANTATINQYHTLGWGTFGGGVNAAEAAKPYAINKKQSRVAFLGYNYADSPHGAPIATETSAGANSFDPAKIKAAITEAKKTADTVFVHVQFDECYAYPAGYAAYPQCYEPVAKQTETFRSIIDMGADMVVGTQAHQPQTFEMYHNKPIYYGLGNLYFEQIQWPGTEQGMVLTHYIHGGKLLQTSISPTVYDTAMQPRLMTDQEAAAFLDSLNAARTHAGL